MAEREFETCHVVFWRGYVKCAFYAVPESGEPIGSPFFRSRERSPSQSGAALDAHRALVDRLSAEGWEPATRGRLWYALTFRRHESSPVEELPPEEPEPPAVVSGVEAHAAPPPRQAEPEPEPAPEPEVAREPEPEPETMPAPVARRSRRQAALLIATAMLITLLVALGLTLFRTTSAQGNDRTQILRTQPQPPALAHRRKSAVRRTLQAQPTTIVVTGSRGDSWVEAKAGSATGKSLFANVVSQGETIRVTAPVVWITFGAAGNLDVRVNGRAPVPGTFNGTVTAVIAHGRVRSA